MAVCNENCYWDYTSCIDIDECELGYCDEQRVCINEDGGYDCVTAIKNTDER